MVSMSNIRFDVNALACVRASARLHGLCVFQAA